MASSSLRTFVKLSIEFNVQTKFDFPRNEKKMQEKKAFEERTVNIQRGNKTSAAKAIQP